MKPVVPRASAVQDIEDAVDHHLSQAGEAVAFGWIDDLEQTFEQLGAHPGAGSTRWDRELGLPCMRSVSLRRHPYVVFYVDREDVVDVWRVLHQRRDLHGEIG